MEARRVLAILISLAIITFGIVLLMNVEIYKKTVKLTSYENSVTISIGIRDYLFNDVFRLKIIERYVYRSFYGTGYEETFKKIENITNELIKSDNTFRAVYSSFASKYNTLQVCFSEVCAQYVLASNQVILQAQVSAGVPTIYILPAYESIILTEYLNKRPTRALEHLIEGYKEGKVVFINTDVRSLLDALG